MGPANDIDNNNAEWYFYQDKFGGRVRKCVKPCMFAGNALASNQQQWRSAITKLSSMFGIVILGAIS